MEVLYLVATSQATPPGTGSLQYTGAGALHLPEAGSSSEKILCRSDPGLSHIPVHTENH